MGSLWGHAWGNPCRALACVRSWAGAQAAGLRAPHLRQGPSRSAPAPRRLGLSPQAPNFALPMLMAHAGPVRPRTPQPGAGAGPRHPRARASPFEPKFDAFPCQIVALHALWQGNLEHQKGDMEGRSYAILQRDRASRYAAGHDTMRLQAGTHSLRRGLGTPPRGAGVRGQSRPQIPALGCRGCAPREGYRAGRGGISAWQPAGIGFGGVTLKYACMIWVTAGTAIVAEPSPRSPEPSTSASTSICGSS